MAIEGGVTDAGSACDVVEARSCAVAREDLLGYLKDTFAVALRIGAGFTGRRWWRELLFWHVNGNGNFVKLGSVPVYLLIRGLSPF